MRKAKDTYIWIPAGRSFGDICPHATHLGIGAHADDLEIIAFDGIIRHFKSKKNNFFGILLSNNRGKPLHPKYKRCLPAKIQKIREAEQKKAASIGEYSGLAFLRYQSSQIRNPFYKKEIEQKIKELIEKLSPSVIYTHSLADRHKTHAAVTLRVIGALRKLPKERRNFKVYGVSVWGDLSWLSDSQRKVFDVSGYEDLASKQLRVYGSQTLGPHCYDVAALSKRRINAICHKSHEFSKSTSLIYAMDLTPLVRNNKLSIRKFLKNSVDKFSRDIRMRLDRMM